MSEKELRAMTELETMLNKELARIPNYDGDISKFKTWDEGPGYRRVLEGSCIKCEANNETSDRNRLFVTMQGWQWSCMNEHQYPPKGGWYQWPAGINVTVIINNVVCDHNTHKRSIEGSEPGEQEEINKEDVKEKYDESKDLASQDELTKYMNNWVALLLEDGKRPVYAYRMCRASPWTFANDKDLRVFLSEYVFRIGKQRLSVFDVWNENANKRKFRERVFNTQHKGDYEDKCNIFVGFQAKELDSYDYSKVEMFEQHVRDIWCDSDPELGDYVLNWFATIVQKPEKSEVALVLKAEEGAGKGSVGKFFIEHIFGKKHAHMLKNMEKELLGNHNEDSVGKVFCVVDEIQQATNKRNNDELKNLITEKFQRINPKGISAYQIEDKRNFIFMTNNEGSMKITPKDRRFVVLRCSDKRVGDLDYFTALHDYLNENGTGDQVYTWLRWRDLREFRVNKIPMTNEKQKLIELSRSRLKEFVEDMWTNDLPMFEGGELTSTEELVDWYGTYIGLTYEEVKKQHKSILFEFEKNMLESAKERGRDMGVEPTTKRVSSKKYPVSARRFVL
jgi:hypothetical protein